MRIGNIAAARTAGEFERKLDDLLGEEHALAQADDPEEDEPEAHARPAPLRGLVGPAPAERLPDERRRGRAERDARRERELQRLDDVRVRGAVDRLDAAAAAGSRRPRAPAALASSWPAVRAKSPKPTIMMTVAAAAGIESLRIAAVSLRDRLLQRIGLVLAAHAAPRSRS